MKLRFSIGAIPLSLLAALFFVVTGNQQFWSQSFGFFSPLNSQNLLMLFSLFSVTLSLMFFLLSLIAIPYLFRPVLTLVLLGNASAAYFMNGYGILIDRDMLQNVFETNPAEALELINLKLIGYLLLLGALPSLLLWRTQIRYGQWRALLGRKDCDFSFSGLKTAASRLAQTSETEQDKADLADAVQKAIARQLAERTERAMLAYAEAHEALHFVVAGGVAANNTIRRTLEDLATKHGFSFLAPPMVYCTDNAAMIALAGAERLEKGLTSDIDVAARPRWPLDEARANADPVHKKTGRKGAKA